MRDFHGSRRHACVLAAVSFCLAHVGLAWAQTPAAAPVAQPAKPAAPAPAAAAPSAPKAPDAATMPAAAAPAPSVPVPSEPAPQSAPTIAPVSPGFPTPVSEVPEAAKPTAPAAAIEPIHPEPEPAPEPQPEPSVQPSAAALAPAETLIDPDAAIVSFKPGKGLDIKSNDGNFSLNVRLKTQLLNEAHKFAKAEDAELRNSFIIRRMRLAFSGNVFSKHIKYKLEMTVAAEELKREQPKLVGMGALPIDRDLVAQVPALDAYFDITYWRDLSLRVGQSKIGYGRERVLSDNDMIVVDRSLEDKEFNFDRDMGIDFRSNDFLGLNLLHYIVGVFMAEDKNASSTSLGVGDLGLLYLARLELVPFGNFEETPVDFERGSPKLSLGVAYVFQQTDATSPYAKQSLGTTLGALNDPAVVDYNTHNFTADALFKASGFSAMTAFHVRQAVDLPSMQGPARNGLGWVLQAGYLLSQDVPLELASSYGLVRALKKTNSRIVESNEFTFGLNYYFFNQHAMKLQGEYAHVWYQDEAIAKSLDDNRLRVQLQVCL